ncbi:hypothetical protein CRUP_006139, partial [Coryphaenoides rupestris]
MVKPVFWALQPLSWLPPGELGELLRSLHAHSLGNDECWLRVVCVLRQRPVSGPPCPQATTACLLGLLGRYAAGIRYALEQQALHKSRTESSQAEEEDTNQSVSSIEDDFVTALEHLEEEDPREYCCTSAALHPHGSKRDVASQTVPAHKRRTDLMGSRVIISSSAKRPATKHKSGPEVSITVQRRSAAESQWTHYNPGTRLPATSTHLSESDDSDGSSPSPIIFLDEVGYQKSLLAKLDIPQVPGGPREPVEDSDSEMSRALTAAPSLLPLDLVNTSNQGQKKKPSETGVGGSKYVSRGCSTKGRNLQRFEQPPLPANVKKPTPLKPGSPYSPQLRSGPTLPVPCGRPMRRTALLGLQSLWGTPEDHLEYFWKSEGDVSELRKPHDLCSLYKTYSDFASSLSREILGSGVWLPVSGRHIGKQKPELRLSQKEFQNPSGHLMKLSEIQEDVTVDKLQQRPKSLKDGIQRLATDLVEMSLGSALRDLQKGMSPVHHHALPPGCQTHLLRFSIGMRRAYVLKERAISGLAGFLVGEAVSGALKEFLAVKKQIFHSTVSQFAADLAEELVFEGIMEVCQFSHPSTPLTPSDWSFSQGRGEAEEDDDNEEEEVVSSYASDLSESVIQEAFIELSQADVAFTSQAAISVSLDNGLLRQLRGHQHTHLQYFHRNTDVPCRPSHLRDSWPIGGERGLHNTTTATQTEQYPEGLQGDTSEGKSPFHHFSGNMVDMIVSEASMMVPTHRWWQGGGRESFRYDGKDYGGERLPVTMDSLDLPGARMAVQRKISIPRDESAPSCGQKSTRTPGTPPSSPQQPSEVSKEKQIRQFSKKLKGKLAKEFSPATPPPTPTTKPEPGPGPTEPSPEADKTDFMVKLMRSLSEEAEGHGQEEEEGEEQEEHGEGRLGGAPRGSMTGDTSRAVTRRMSNKEAFHYAERLACHIVSMATEVDTHIGTEKAEKEKEDGSRNRGVEVRRDNVAQFPEETLNTLWVYGRGGGGGSHRPGLSSQYPSCESVTDEYAGYLIRVLKKEGGSRELVLDQYASRFSIPLHQARPDPRCPARSSTSLPPLIHSTLPGPYRRIGRQSAMKHPHTGPKPGPGENSVCTCSRNSEEHRQREYTDLVNFAESLASSITCDVTRKLCLPPTLLPKSLTEPCLYRKPKLEDMEGKGGSEGGYGSEAMRVIEHYARKIAEDTVELCLSTAGHVSGGPSAPQIHQRFTHADRLSEGAAPGDVVCHYCQVQACHRCTKAREQHNRQVGPRMRAKKGPEYEGGAEHLSSLEIPKIHIDLDLRVAFAEEMVSVAMETAKRELSNTSLNADSGIGQDGPSYADSLTAEIMTSALSNLGQPADLSLSSHGNSSTWSSLGAEGEVGEEHLSFSPLDSDSAEDKEAEVKEDSSGTLCMDKTQAPKALLVLVNSDLREVGHEPEGAVTLDPQVRCMLQWAAASMAELPQVHLSAGREMLQLQAVVCRLQERDCRMGDLLQALLRYCEEVQAQTQDPDPDQNQDQVPVLPRGTPSLTPLATPLFQWLLE